MHIKYEPLGTRQGQVILVPVDGSGTESLDNANDGREVLEVPEQRIRSTVFSFRT